MSNSFEIDGEVWINGEIVYSSLTPRFPNLDHGLYLERLQRSNSGSIISDEGPHFHFKMPTARMIMSVPHEKLLSGAKYSLTGPDLGAVSMLSGYPAADLGSFVRTIVKMNFEIGINSENFLFNISGKTTDILPWSINDPRQNQKLYANPIEFNIWFHVPEDALSMLRDPDVFTNSMKKIILLNQSK